MIVLYNPWSTPSAKTPLPMSLLADASNLGERPWELVDGNLVADPVTRIAATISSRVAVRRVKRLPFRGMGGVTGSWFVFERRYD